MQKNENSLNEFFPVNRLLNVSPKLLIMTYDDKLYGVLPLASIKNDDYNFSVIDPVVEIRNNRYTIPMLLE